jgi:hypothetical protein
MIGPIRPLRCMPSWYIQGQLHLSFYLFISVTKWKKHVLGYVCILDWSRAARPCCA